MNYFGAPIQFIFSKDLNRNTAKGAGDLIHTNTIDFDHFKRTTKDSVVIMGYKTYMTLDKPLPDRINVVYSELPLRSGELRSGFLSIQDSHEVLQREIELFEREVFCIGGVQTFESMMRYLNSIPEVMWVTTYFMKVEDGNCPADFFYEIQHLYKEHVIFHSEDMNITMYMLHSDDV